jgi:phage FluMu protein Com
MMTVECPSCNKVYDIPETMGGKQVQCKKCGMVFAIASVEQALEAPADARVPAVQRERLRPRPRHYAYVLLGIGLLCVSMFFKWEGGTSRTLIEDGADVWAPVVAGMGVILCVLFFLPHLRAKGAILLVLGLVAIGFGVGLMLDARDSHYPLPPGAVLAAIGGALVSDGGLGTLCRRRK